MFIRRRLGKRCQKYCSRGCASKHANKAANISRWGPRIQKEKTCKQCQGKFYVTAPSESRRKFCGMACMAINQRERWKKQRESRAITCKNCQKHCAPTHNNVRKAFCSQACCKAWMVGENSVLYRGNTTSFRGPLWHALAESIRERDGHVCRRCGKTTTENNKRLHVDHIRPWRDFNDTTEANHPDNLVSLCSSCHSRKTTTLERRWLKGDYLALRQFRREIGKNDT